jgi:hypothetical protein
MQKQQMKTSRSSATSRNVRCARDKMKNAAFKDSERATNAPKSSYSSRCKRESVESKSTKNTTMSKPRFGRLTASTPSKKNSAYRRSTKK